MTLAQEREKLKTATGAQQRAEASNKVLSETLAQERRDAEAAQQSFEEAKAEQEKAQARDSHRSRRLRGVEEDVLAPGFTRGVR